MQSKSNDKDISKVLCDIRSELYTLMQIIRLYADTTAHELVGEHVITVQAQTFCIVMDHFASQLEKIIGQTDALRQRRHHSFERPLI